GEPACVLFRREAFERVGGYDPFLEHATDLDFALRLLDTGAIVYLNEALVARRLHTESATNQNIRSGAAARDRHRLYHRYRSRLILVAAIAVAGGAALARRHVVIGLVTLTGLLPVIVNMVLLPRYGSNIAVLFALGSAALIVGGILPSIRTPGHEKRKGLGDV